MSTPIQTDQPASATGTAQGTAAVRENPFKDEPDADRLPEFSVKARAGGPPPEHVDRLAAEQGFPSRSVPRPKARRGRALVRRRVAKTVNDTQLNIKAPGDTVERFYRIANDRNLALGQVLTLALEALEKAGSQGD